MRLVVRPRADAGLIEFDRRLAALPETMAAGLGAALELARDYAELISPRRTGALAAAHVVQDGRLIIDPGAVNPHGQRPAEYGPIVHSMGAERAFYARTMAEVGREMARVVIDGVVSEIG